MEVTFAKEKMPMTRALAWQAFGAIDLARDRGKLPASFDEGTIIIKVSKCVLNP